ncbi:hypothetical protein [Glutamicibacter soli]
MIITNSQGQRLTTILQAVRPDWNEKGIVKALQDANKGEGLPAIDFDHAMRASVAYGTAKSRDGSYLKQTPLFVAQPGPHWDDTAPPGAGYQSAPPAWCEDHPTFNAHNCACCWADIRVGDRPDNMLGKRMIRQDDTPPGEPRMTIAEAKHQIKQMQATEFLGGSLHSKE